MAPTSNAQGMDTHWPQHGHPMTGHGHPLPRAWAPTAQQHCQLHSGFIIQVRSEMLLLAINIKFQSKKTVSSFIFHGLHTQNSNKHFNHHLASPLRNKLKMFPLLSQSSVNCVPKRAGEHFHTSTIVNSVCNATRTLSPAHPLSVTEGHRYWILDSVLWKSSWQWNSRKNTLGQKRRSKQTNIQTALKRAIGKQTRCDLLRLIVMGRTHTKLLCFISTFIFWNPIQNKGKRCKSCIRALTLPLSQHFPREEPTLTYPTWTSTLTVLNGFRRGRNQTHRSRSAAASSSAQRRPLEVLQQIALIGRHWQQEGPLKFLSIQSITGGFGDPWVGFLDITTIARSKDGI